MATKVFLFGTNSWLYCYDLKHKNGIWTGWVRNGEWFLHFDENNNIIKACKDARSTKNPVTVIESVLTWACDPFKSIFDYNAVIEDARVRYEAGEESNLVLSPPKKQVKEDYEDDIPY